jgi:hypothetical protein
MGSKHLICIAKAHREYMVDGTFDTAKKAMIGENSMVSLVRTLLSHEHL